MTSPDHCLTGCTTTGAHLGTCEGECRGCVPRPAEYGHLCPWCWQRLNADITDLPELVAHLREVAEPHAQAAPPSDGRSKNDPAERNLLNDAINASDELHAALASWAHLIVEEHPTGLHGPDQRGAWITRDGSIAGIKPDSEATRRLVRWITPHLEWAASQDWAAEMRKELSQLIATTRARWPQADTRTRPIPDTPCPRCQHLALTYTPPSEYRAAFVVSCHNAECAHVYTEDEWDACLSALGRTA